MFIFGVCRIAQAALTPEADQMYAKYHSAILQVKEVARGSKEKSGIGSGFFFSEDGLIATNYHVVADAANYPELFRVEYILPGGKSGPLEILNIDPVHDLAILKGNVPAGQFLDLGDSKLAKGARIFSFGNPLDLGLIIVEGLFNGLLEQSRYPKILFSGSLNPGMSGGPAIGSDGRVLGVNEATAGNEISFFVPVEYLIKLRDELKANDSKTMGPHWRNLIRKRLILESEEMIGGILEKPWIQSEIGSAIVPGKIAEVIRCWGESGDNVRYWVKGDYLVCSTEDQIYLSSTLSTGNIQFNYSSYVPRANDPMRFYNIYEDYQKYDRFDFNRARERDLSNFSCDQEFVNIGGRPCKTDICARRYKHYEGLYDMTMKVTSTDQWDKGLVVNVLAEGVTEMQGKRFFLRFLKEIRWKK